MTRRRWVCPECNTGSLGPERPRKNATIRYCLTCSARSTTLVERYCPALETKRAQKAAARKGKAQRASAARAEKRQIEKQTKARVEAFNGSPKWLPYMVDGIDTLRLWGRVCRYLGVDLPSLNYGSARLISHYGVVVVRKWGTENTLYHLIWNACLYAKKYRRRFSKFRDRHGYNPELNQLAGSIAVDVLGLDKEKVYDAVANHRSVVWGNLTEADVDRLRELPRLAKMLSKPKPSPRALTQRACLDERGLVLLDQAIEWVAQKGAA